MARRGSVLAITALGLLAACSSDSVTTQDPTTVAPATPAETSTATPTSPRPTTTTTTVAATTTIDPAAELAAEVEADLLEAFRLGREALQDPFDSVKEQQAVDRRLGVIADNLVASLAEFREKNYAIRANEAVPASVTIESPPRFFGAGSEVAEVQICELNSWIVVEVGAGPDGTDAVVDPDVVASRATIFMRSVDGDWRFEGSTLIAEWEGASACDPA